MKASISRWIGSADVLRDIELFHAGEPGRELTDVRARGDDYFLALVGELFDAMRQDYLDSNDWARLGNAFALLASLGEEYLDHIGVSAHDPVLYGASAFYSGGFPASAYLTLKEHPPAQTSTTEPDLACFDFLGRPQEIRSRTVLQLLYALRHGQADVIREAAAQAKKAADEALLVGPREWIPARVLQQLVTRFSETNIRAVLPDGYTVFWNELVASLLNRRPPIWEFFPSQIEAIQSGLLERSESFSLQMPTGAGKTALCEALLYWHLKRNPADAAILLVPYRSLAAELRRSLVMRLNKMGILSRCVYGGTVPSGDEVQSLENTRAIVATPESLSGLLSAGGRFLQRISLVICDEGHLLDSGGRGVGLELLLARMMARSSAHPRFVFVSAIVPNIEEINSWLGGTSETAISSDYRPALADFARLWPSGSGSSLTIALHMHPHEPTPTQYSIERFLGRDDFSWRNSLTRRINTYSFSSYKTRAVAAARKALPLGAAAVFAANKRGTQGALGLAEELLEQLNYPLGLPMPITYAETGKVSAAAKYLEDEYGPAWTGAKMLAAGAVLHHGDIPQESREVIEDLIRQGAVQFVICTSTLAEGVNLPIRTLVLYSVQRRAKTGLLHDLLIRDIKNLVGRAGRAGVTTKGLVICANEQQWPLVQQVAIQAAGEPVTGALRALLRDLLISLASNDVELSNAGLEERPDFHTLIDGIDATLIDLAAEEIGEEELRQLAVLVADQTFAAQQVDEASKVVLRTVFELRAHRIFEIRTAGRLDWIQETGARARMLDAVETGLLPLRAVWDDIVDPLEPELVETVLNWAWEQGDLQKEVIDAYRIKPAAIESVRESFFTVVRLWLLGARFREIAEGAKLLVDDLLGVYTGALSFALQTIVEQGIALLAKFEESQGRILSPAVAQFPEHLRFGVSTAPARALVAGGVRHRSAAVLLGAALVSSGISSDDRMTVFAAAKRLLQQDPQGWNALLGALVANNAVEDIDKVTVD